MNIVLIRSTQLKCFFFWRSTWIYFMSFLRPLGSNQHSVGRNPADSPERTVYSEAAVEMHPAPISDDGPRPPHAPHLITAAVMEAQRSRTLVIK